MRWTDADVAFIHRSHARGESYAKIAATLGLTKSQVKNAHRRDLARTSTPVELPCALPTPSEPPPWHRLDEPDTAPDLPLIRGNDRLLIIPDTHAPFEDKRAFGLVLEVARLVKPTAVAILGDFADFYKVSDHPKDPALRGLSFADELERVNDLLDRIDAVCPGGDRHYIEGNHEFRLQRYLWKNAPELVGLPSSTVPELLNLEKRGWSFTPYHDALRIGKLWLTHDDDAAGRDAHHRARLTFEGNVAIGHTHRMAVSYHGNAHGEPKVGAMFGWLGDRERVDYLKRVKARQWQLGFGLATFEPSGNMHLQAVPIVDHACLVNGDVVRG